MNLGLPLIVIGVLAVIYIVLRIVLKGSSWTLKNGGSPHGATCPKCGSSKTRQYKTMQSITTFPGSRRGNPRVYYLAVPDGGVWECKGCKNIFKIDN